MRTFGLLILTAWPLLAAPAMAETETLPRTTVSFGDLNLRTEAGATALRERIDHAITAISGSQVPVDSLIPLPGLGEARERGREQADALIAAAHERQPAS